MSTARRLPKHWQLYAAFAYGTLIALLFAFVIYPMQGMIAAAVDLNGFGELSRNLAEGRGFSFNYGPTVRRAPLYPFLGAALLSLFGGSADAPPDAAFYRPLIVANCVFIGLSCATIWHVANRYLSVRTAVVAVLMCPLIPQSIRYVGMTEVETLMGLFIMLLAATGLGLVARPSPATGATFGVVAAGATLSKPIVLLYPFLFLPLAVWHWRRNGVPWRGAALASGVTLAVFVSLLVPWSVRNSVVTEGKFKGISSNAPGEFLRGYVNAQPKYYLLKQDFGGNAPGTEKWDPEANDYEVAVFRKHGSIYYQYRWNEHGRTVIHPTPPAGVSSAMLEIERDRVENVEMKQRLLASPGEFVHKFVVQLAMFWYIVETRTKSLFVGAIALAMLALSVVGAVDAWRRNKLFWPVVAVLVYFNAIYAAFLAFARYSMPLYPTLSILAANGIVAIGERVFRLGPKVPGQAPAER